MMTNATMAPPLPEDFIWGVSASGYQSEGGALDSNWARVERRKGHFDGVTVLYRAGARPRGSGRHRAVGVGMAEAVRVLGDVLVRRRSVVEAGSELRIHLRRTFGHALRGLLAEPRIVPGDLLAG